MKTATFVCPSCGAPLDFKNSSSSIICEYCGSVVHYAFSKSEMTTFENRKPLFSSLVERKYIYYIPRFDGITDCYTFLLDYGEAAFLFEKNKEVLSEEETKLIIRFFETGREYISNCVKKNINDMLASQLDKYEYAFLILNEAKLRCGTFEDLLDLIVKRSEELRASAPKEVTVEKARNKFWIIFGIIFAAAVLTPGIISFIVMLIYQMFS